jgi:ornithine cyclodeaminase
MTTPSQHIPKLYTLDQINKVISESTSFETDLIRGIQEGFVALEQGAFYACPIQTMGLPPFPFVEGVDGYAAQTCVKSGYFKGQDYYVIKVASGGHPMENSGLMQVYSQQTGQLEALLLDNGILTELRTAAVGALAAKLLAPKKIQSIGIVGTGIQARYQLEMLPTVTECRNVLVWGRNVSKANAFRDEMVPKGWQVRIAESTDDLLTECDLIVTTTCAREALLQSSAMASRKKTTGLHITCIGADAPGKHELDPKLVAKADLLVADTVQQTLERGEFQKAVADGLVERDSIVSLGNLLLANPTNLHRKEENDPRLTIFDSSGVALQDCVISQLTYDALRQKD